MVWTAEKSKGHESDKIAHLLPQYCVGTGLDIGCGDRPAWPAMIGVDNGRYFGKAGASIMCDATRLDVFADKSMDYIFSSHMLEHVIDPKAVLKAWWGKIKVTGTLILYLPHKALYPNIGEEGSNPDHCHDFVPADIVGFMTEIAAETGEGWVQLEEEERNQADEYSFFAVFRKLDTGRTERRLWERHPGGKQRCLVIRYGAIGDQIIASSVLPLLKQQGYHVTYNTTPQAAAIVRLDPNIDEFMPQAKDFVPNEQLGPFWEALAERYDKIVNLCESMEATLLHIPGRMSHHYSDQARRRLSGKVNYLELVHDIAEVPPIFAPRFYPSEEERREAARVRAALGAPVVLWSVAGSSIHKVYPFTHVVAKWLIEETDCHVVIVSDPGIGKALQDGIIEAVTRNGGDPSRLHGKAGTWGIRQALAFTECADCVVGPETGVLNAASFLPVPKVVMLSHSSHDNLTKHWWNTVALMPVDTPCFPCHRMHYGWEFCHKVEETAAALCASNISPERVFRAIRDKLERKRAA